MMFYVPIVGNEFNQLAQSILNKELQNINLKNQVQEQEYKESKNNLSMNDQLEKMLKMKQAEGYDLYSDKSHFNILNRKKFTFNKKEATHKLNKTFNFEGRKDGLA